MTWLEPLSADKAVLFAPLLSNPELVWTSIGGKMLALQKKPSPSTGIQITAPMPAGGYWKLWRKKPKISTKCKFIQTADADYARSRF